MDIRRREFLAAAGAWPLSRALCFQRGMQMDTVQGSATAVLWRQRDGQGLEQCRVLTSKAGIVVDGGVVMEHEDRTPWRIDYEVRCDHSWITREVTVHAHAGPASHALTLAADSSGRWRVNGSDRPDLQGCTDVDLGFSPCTNTLPIRRLQLAQNQSATIEAAWVEFPSLTVKRLSQRYTRTADRTYRYENLPTGFAADIAVDGLGLVVSYPPGWERVGPSTPFGDVLLSSAPSPELGDAAALYAGLMGSWDLEAVDYDSDGTRRTTEGEWHFSWVLEGRAIQDVFIVPKRSARDGSLGKKGNRYGATVRFYDPASGDWLITWINPVTGAVNRLAARREGNRIVQVGTDPDGTMRRWTFADITADRFHWIGEESTDEGVSWRTGAEFFARRRQSR